MKATEKEKMEIPSRMKLFRRTNSKKKNPSRRIPLLTMTTVTILIGAQIPMKNPGAWGKFFFRIFGLPSYVRNSQKKQYLIFGEIINIFFFAYLSAVWLLFGYNPIEIIVYKFFLLDFAQIVTKQLIYKQNWKIFPISPNIEYCFF